MSKTVEEREKIKRYLLKHIGDKDPDTVSKAIETYSTSRTTIYAYLRQLEMDNVIVKDPTSACNYSLVVDRRIFSYSTADGLDEDIIFKQDIQPLLSGLPKNALEIWRYGFCEMMNNAIEHATADNIYCIVDIDYVKTVVFIKDDGIGIYNNIRNYFLHTLNQEISVDEAIMQLAAGKLTTAKKGHSGEGIFFTSRAFDKFLLCSDMRVFTHDNFSESLISFTPEELNMEKGTAVFMMLSNTSKRKLNTLFDRFSDADTGFSKTQIPIAQVFPDDYPMARSEARRLAASVARFVEVELDFTNVENLGQAFAHELFVVFANEHPNTKLIPTNANAAVKKMIGHVTAS